MWEDDYRFGYVHMEWDRRFVMDEFGNAIMVPWYAEPYFFMGEH